MASKAEANKTDNNSKKLVQPRLSNFFANSKIHVSSIEPKKPAGTTDVDGENDENHEPLTKTLTTHVESTASSMPAEPLVKESPKSASNVPSVTNFLKTPIAPSSKED